MESEKKPSVKYYLDLNNRPFMAIKRGTKKVEGRVPTGWDTTAFQEMKAGDQICFTNNSTGEVMSVDVLFVHHYKTVRAMLEAEGVTNVSSSTDNIEKSIEGYNSIEGYEDNIPKYGIYAIGLKLIAT